jgi:hypothetical protein
MSFDTLNSTHTNTEDELSDDNSEYFYDPIFKLVDTMGSKRDNPAGNHFDTMYFIDHIYKLSNSMGSKRANPAGNHFGTKNFIVYTVHAPSCFLGPVGQAEGSAARFVTNFIVDFNVYAVHAVNAFNTDFIVDFNVYAVHAVNVFNVFSRSAAHKGTADDTAWH